MRRPLLLVLALAFAGCSTDTTVLSPRCDLTLGSPSPDPVARGQVVTLPASPLTSSWDTAVYVGGARATVLEVVREDCDACDECRETAECTACGDCDACDLECDQRCVETIQFQVPDQLSGGDWPLWVYNLHGTGGPISLEVSAPVDTGTGDDSGSSDGGTTDDTGGGTTDGGTTDGGTTDGGTTDGGTTDGGTTK